MRHLFIALSLSLTLTLVACSSSDGEVGEPAGQGGQDVSTQQSDTAEADAVTPPLEDTGSGAGASQDVGPGDGSAQDIETTDAGGTDAEVADAVTPDAESPDATPAPDATESEVIEDVGPQDSDVPDDGTVGVDIDEPSDVDEGTDDIGTEDADNIDVADSTEDTDDVSAEDAAEQGDTDPGDVEVDDAADDADNDGTEDAADEDTDSQETPGDGDSDGVIDEEDNCPDIPNEEQTDSDEDGEGDACDDDDDNDGVADGDDDFPFDPNEQTDTDGDGIGDTADDDIDGDGLSNDEEAQYGVDCSITNPLMADTDGDGVSDPFDAYPRDPFPAFITQENVEGSITVITADGQGGFAEPTQVGQDLLGLCAPEDSNCNPGCPEGSYCSLGTCVVEDGSICDAICPTSEVCRQRLYRQISIADFDADGTMDFIAHSYPPEEDGTRQLWFFYRLNVSGTFPQVYLGQVDSPISGTVADINGDYRFDVVAYSQDKPSNIADVTAVAYLGHGVDPVGGCPLGDSASGCAFQAVPDAIDITDIVSNQWGAPRAREAQDLNGDGVNDLVFGTYAHGGNAPTDVYMLPSLGDGTFGPAVSLFTHNVSGSGQGPANSMVFADFTSDGVGDVIMGFDDDGDAGSGWLYAGSDGGTFSGDYVKAVDINLECDTGCADEVGRTGNAKTFDINFDGAMDVLVGYYPESAGSPPSKLVVFYGLGDGTFEAPLQIGPIWPGREAMTFQVPQRLCPWYAP